MPASVGPGGQANFAFQIIAPSTPGSYNFQWRMLQEGVEWFGAFTPNVAVTVTASAPHNDAQVIGVSVPAVMTQGQGYTIAVTMKNSGNITWPAGSAYALGSSIPQNTMLWGENRVPLNSTVAPGQQTDICSDRARPKAESLTNELESCAAAIDVVQLLLSSAAIVQKRTRRISSTTFFSQLFETLTSYISAPLHQTGPLLSDCYQKNSDPNCSFSCKRTVARRL